MLRIKFKGEEFLLIDDGEGGGAIATEDAYRNGTCSHAHLYEDGVVRRFGKEIGTRGDVEVVREVGEKIELSHFALLNVITDPSWNGNN